MPKPTQENIDDFHGDDPKPLNELMPKPNNTTQPMEELDEILAGLVDWAESGRSKLGRPDGVCTISEAKTKLTKLISLQETKARIDELDKKLISTIGSRIVWDNPSIHQNVTDRINELEATLNPNTDRKKVDV